MGLGRFVHHIGTFCVFAAFILLIVVDVTAPVVNGLSMLRVDLGRNAANAQDVTFGTFGYCIRGIPNVDDECTHSKIGYDPAYLMHSLDGSRFGSGAASTSHALTKVMVLHPVATGLAFIAFLLCAGAGIIGSLLASLLSVLAFVVALVAMICDFVCFAIIKRDVNDWGVSRARWGSGIWLILVSSILLLIGATIVFLTCCFGRKKSSADRQKETWNEPPATTSRRRRFW